MDALLVRSLADIAAIQARIEGMKAGNADRLHHGYSVAYPESDFFAAERELEEISAALKKAYA